MGKSTSSDLVVIECKDRTFNFKESNLRGDIRLGKADASCAMRHPLLYYTFLSTYSTGLLEIEIVTPSGVYIYISKHCL